MTLKSLSNKAAPMVVAGVALGLMLHYGGNLPIIDKAVKGFNGDTSATNWFGFTR